MNPLFAAYLSIPIMLLPKLMTILVFKTIPLLMAINLFSLQHRHHLLHLPHGIHLFPFQRTLLRAAPILFLPRPALRLLLLQHFQTTMTMARAFSITKITFLSPMSMKIHHSLLSNSLLPTLILYLLRHLYRHEILVVNKTTHLSTQMVSTDTPLGYKVYQLPNPIHP